MLQDLSWLPVPPDNYREMIGAIRRDLSTTRDVGDIWERLKRLAAYALDEVQLAQLARIVSNLPDEAGLPARLKVGILGDGTLSLLGPAITASALRWDLRVEVIEGEYSRAMNEAMDTESSMHRAAPDVLLIACDRRSLGLMRAGASPDESRAAVEAAFTNIRSIADNMRRSVRAAILVQTIVPPPDALFGSHDLLVSESPYAQVNTLNSMLVSWAAESNVLLVDAARLASSVGLVRWDDPQQWHSSKLPFSADMIPLYADFVGRTLGALRGKSRKCLVLDLDNTLWGGVIGDDGLAGIKLGQGSAAGEAFLAIQNMALSLRNRGVVLAVSSKNDEKIAKGPFLNHTEMLLKTDHIAVFQANWSDKASNLRSIAQTLNIDLSSLVLLDDNPAERAQVRRELPMVAVPELPSHPAFYPRALLAAGYFDVVSFSEEDRKRADYYGANAERASLKVEGSDLTEYLRSLAMICTIRPFDAQGRPRIAQLINKTNQFNLTTTRYTELEVSQIEADPQKYAVQIRLLDRFGDNGMISVVIADKGDRVWLIDTWLMSCRVLGRRVEEAVLANLVAAARASGAESLVGRYIPTAKNKLVCDLYEKLGFRQIGAEGAATIWELKLADYITPDIPMQVDNDTGLRLQAAE